jgi:DNA-binding response OmpR family regulator
MRILIVEDEAPMALMLSHIARKEGHEVVAVCTTAQEALDAVLSSTMDLVLLDINLCGPSDGITCGRELMHRGCSKLIYITSYADDTTLNEAMETRPINFLVKPVIERDIVIALALAEKAEIPIEAQKRFYSFGNGYTFRYDRDEVDGPEGSIVLSHRELLLLKLLLDADGVCLDSETIAHALESEPLETATVRSLIRRLRRKLPGAVKTVTGYGYRIDIQIQN